MRLGVLDGEGCRMVAVVDGSDTTRALTEWYCPFIRPRGQQGTAHSCMCVRRSVTERYDPRGFIKENENTLQL